MWRYPMGRGLTADETASFVSRCEEGWRRDGLGLWAARLVESGELIGYLGLSVPTFCPEILPAVEVGWRLGRRYWGCGLATEGARAALRWGFVEAGLEEICSLPQVENERSGAVCERLGMTRTRDRVLAPTANRGSVTVADFRVSRSEWSAGSTGVAADS